MPSQLAGDGGPPTKWSFSSAVTTNSVFAVVILSALRRAKNFPKALSYVRVGDVAVDHRHAALQHRGQISQTLRGRGIERIWEARIAFGILDHIAVEVLDRTARRDLRLDIGIAEQCTEALILNPAVGWGCPVCDVR
jgi:hypothetical protein